MVDIMDALSPEYRFEHSTEEAAVWYQKRGYKDIQVSTTNQFGFSIHGKQQMRYEHRVLKSFTKVIQLV